MLSRKVMSGGAPTDPYFKNVVLLLHGDGTNGGQNNTFIDGSSNNFTITRNGNTTQGSFNPYGTLWSNYFDGTGDYLTAPDNAAFQFGTGNFTVEAWIRLTTTVGEAYNSCLIVGNNAQGITTNWILGVEVSTRKLFFYAEIAAGGAVNPVSTTAINFNQWYHVAVSRTGGTLRLFLNGVYFVDPVYEFSNSSVNFADGLKIVDFCLSLL